jgi:hypothetical protein
MLEWLSTMEKAINARSLQVSLYFAASLLGVNRDKSG